MQQSMAQVAMPDTVCIGTSRIYKVNEATVPSTYTWKIDGVTQASTRNELSITWNVAGTFLLTVQEHANNGCDGDVQSGLVYVMPAPVANAGPDMVVCFGIPYRLNGSGGNTYLWSPSTYLSETTAANPRVNIPFAGTYNYILNVTSRFGCKSLSGDTVILTILQPVNIFAGRDTSIVINQPLQLNAADVGNSGFINYTWSPSFGLNNPFINNPVAIIDRTTRYLVIARTGNGCVAQDEIEVKVFVKADLYVPTGFTPDGDGLNDFAKVIPAGIMELKYFRIYSRWGELVFTTSDASIGWNGVYKGQKQNGNVYIWVAEGIDYKGNKIFRKGTVTLIR